MNQRLSAFFKMALIIAIPFVMANVPRYLNIPEFTFLFTSIGIIIFGILIILSPYLILAPANLFFTLVPENKVKYVVSGGKLKKIILSSNKYRLDENYNVEEGKGGSSGLRGGLHLYGIWPFSDILVYRFKWINITIENKIVPHDEILDNVILKADMYLLELKGAEDKDLIPLTVKTVVTIRITNPYNAMFEIQDWLEATAQTINSAVRNEIRKDSFHNLIDGDLKATTYTTLGENIFKELEKKRSDEGINNLKSLKEKIGVTVSAVRVINIDPESNVRNLTLKRTEAKINADVIVTEAKGTADAIEIKAKGEAAAFITKANAWEEKGMDPVLGVTLEQLESSHLDYSLFGGTVPDFLKKVFDKKR
ncbi:MAG: SPFH/Band 7/PHB domain protein [Candidatus Pacebacteria bacterium]|nr:SPFH/Band 7/PHB domain protein [Candidatus Paceibacterota bacterium]